ncbi:hypothetical protein ACA910_003044 [Epithemia clementina (nom. ined.)]
MTTTTTRPFSSSTQPLSSSSSSPPFLWKLQVLPSVQAALDAQQPVVALESTLVAHGMPFPDNLELYQRVAQLLRDRGVEPATIALCNGACRIGLTPAELSDLAQAATTTPGRVVPKCSTRDLPIVLAQQQEQLESSRSDSTATAAVPNHLLWGATTVASTMVLAHAAGISTFVTGGIGGVHRGAEDSMDISADLLQLAQTPVVVVSAGIKSILDIRKTLEVLETYSVPVVSYQCDDFPAFFSPHSQVPSPARVDHASTIARAFCLSQQLFSNSTTSSSFRSSGPGMLVGVPNDDPAGAAVEDAIQAALARAKELNITGRDVTPFVLKQVAEQTQGDSLRSNQHLVERNAVVGAEIAKAICQIQRQQYRRHLGVVVPVGHGNNHNSKGKNNDDHQEHFHASSSSSSSTPPARIVVMGGIIVDRVAQPLPSHKLLLYTSNPATCTESDGGVGRNIAETLGRLGSRPLLYSAVGGNDHTSTYHHHHSSSASADTGEEEKENDIMALTRSSGLLHRLVHECGVQITSESLVVVPQAYTPCYLAVLDSEGDLHTALCANTEHVFPAIAIPSVAVWKHAQYLVVDANLSLTTLAKTVQQAYENNVLVFLEPTSVPKAAHIGNYYDSTSKTTILEFVGMASPNVAELVALVRGHSDTEPDELTQIEDDDGQIRALCRTLLLEKMNLDRPKEEIHLFVTQGAKGVLHACRRLPKNLGTFSTKADHDDGVAPTDDIVFCHYHPSFSGTSNAPTTDASEIPEEDEVVVVANTTGAGDTFTGALLHALLQGHSMDTAIRFGMSAAVVSLACPDRAVSPKLSPHYPPLLPPIITQKPSMHMPQ